MVNKKHWFQQFIAVFCLAIAIFATGCTQVSEPPNPYTQVQEESTQGAQRNQAVEKDAVNGSRFNAFFPGEEGGYSRIYTQEKRGFAEAKLKKDGQDVAILSISDTISNPTAQVKFAQAEQSLKGYPAVLQGSTGTALLVGDRFQVKVLSRDPNFTESERLEWLQKFDLDGLAQLQ